MSLKILLSMSVMRVSGELEPFWRDSTKRLVVIVERTSPRKLTAWGIDPDADDRDAFVFKASFAASRLHGFIAAVLGSSRESASGIPPAPSGAARSVARKRRRVVVRLSEPRMTAIAPSTPDPDRDVVVVSDPGLKGGPRKSLLALGRRLLAANATDLPPTGTDSHRVSRLL